MIAFRSLSPLLYSSTVFLPAAADSVLNQVLTEPDDENLPKLVPTSSMLVTPLQEAFLPL